jgi:serine/threonine-protein kinase
VGALAYFLLSGRPPFPRQSAVATLAAHLYEAPEPVRRHRPDVSEDLDAVVLRCLAKEPSGRFRDVDDLETSLDQCSRRQRWSREEAAAWW